MQELNDNSVIEKFVQAELEKPSPRKVVNGNTIYLSRLFEPPKKFGKALLCDFGSAVQGEEQRHHNAQPEIFRSPEVMLMADWSYPIDIWNVGAMVSITEFQLDSVILTRLTRPGSCSRATSCSRANTLPCTDTSPVRISQRSSAC